MAEYDIAIIGAGPAGATLARLIGNSYRVLLIDKRKMAEPPQSETYHKCCGGLVAPDAQVMLARLGLGIPQKVLVGQQLFVVRTMDLEHQRECYYQRHYINIDREKFDRWLISLIPDRVATRFGWHFISYTGEEGKYTFKYRHQGKVYTETAKVLIGADGAGSLLRKLAFPNHKKPKAYIAIQEWFATGGTMPYFSAIFDREITDFYSWTIPKDDYLLVGAALEAGEGASAKFDLLKKKLTTYGFQLGAQVKREGAFIFRPRSTREICPGEKGIALVGEAAGFISPSSAEGLSYGFWSALKLANSLETGIDGFADRYRNNTGSLRRNIIMKNLKAPFMYNSQLRNMVMRTGLLSIKVEKEKDDE